MALKRVKDAGFIQLHIEKLLLGAGILVLLIALFLFVLAKPFAIEVSNKPYESPRAAIEILERQDRTLEVGLMDDNPITIDEPPRYDLEISAMIEKGLVVPEITSRVASFGLTPVAITPITPMSPRYATVMPPAPINIKHKIGTDVLDPGLNQDPEAFHELWGAKTNDFTMFIASGDFEIAKWADRLENIAEDADGGKIPVGIWSQRFGIAGVALLREEKDPATGEWTNRVIVEALPGQVRLLPGDDAPSNAVESVETLTELRESQFDIAQPGLPVVISFDEIVPPGDADEDEGAGRIRNFGVAGELGRTEQRIAQLEEKIEALQERERILQERQRGNGGGNRRDVDPTRTPAPTATPTRQSPMASQIERLREQIEKLRPQAEKERAEREEKERKEQERLERLRERERRLGQLREERAGGKMAPQFAQLEGIQLEEDETVRVYAADPTMRPGMTYRYKLLVATINPLYAMPNLAEDQLAENQSKAALFPSDEEIDAMPWIQVSTEPTIRYYYVREIGSRGKVEVYRRVNGEIMVESFDVSPGDVVGGMVDDADMSTGLVLVDIEPRRNPSGGTDSRMILVDEAGNLHERYSSIDSKAPALKDLKDEISDGPEWNLRPDEEDVDRFEGGTDVFPDRYR